MKCDRCGQFIKVLSNWSWASIYDISGFCLDREDFRCEKCTNKYGAIESNARPYDRDMSPYQGYSKHYYESKQ